jgi:signal transduction histidine kinase
MARSRPIPFALVAPATIILFGLAVTLASTFLGVRELSAHAQESAAFRAKVLARALAARLAELPLEAHAETLNRAAQNCDCTLLIVNGQRRVVHAAPDQPLTAVELSSLHFPEGQIHERTVPLTYASSPIPQGTQRLMALTSPPDTAAAKNRLISSMIAFSVILLAAGGFVGFALARDVHADVLYVRDQIVSMAEARTSSQTKAIPVRTIDQVGELTASFNTLVERFQAAERAYRQDLSEAKNFDKDRAAFLAALSHELRTPLNSILGFADVLLNEIDGPLSAEAHENLTVVRTSGEHLRSLIDDILALSALESGEFRLSREQFDLREVAEDVVTEARVTAHGKGLTITLNVAGPHGNTMAYADRRRVRQIFTNLISNAVKFTSRGGVSVRLEKNGDEVITKVSDTGPGIAEEQLEAIFEEFRQADSQSVRRMGTGLGLSITRRHVQMHGGIVRAESHLGKGTTMTVRLPIEEPTYAGSVPMIPVVRDTIIREA